MREVPYRQPETFCLRTCVLSVLILAALPWAGVAHPVLRESIEHRTHVRADLENIDVEIVLAFHETPSRHERNRMDSDADGQISPSECAAYIQASRDTWREALAMTVAGVPVDVMMLYEPRIDLMGRPRVAKGEHQLHLTVFARLPSGWRDGSVIELNDQLWPEIPRIVNLQATGEGGVAVEVNQADGWNWNAREPGQPLLSRLTLSRKSRGANNRMAGGLAENRTVTDGARTLSPDAVRHGPLGVWPYALAFIAAVSIAAWLKDRRTDPLKKDLKRETS